MIDSFFHPPRANPQNANDGIIYCRVSTKDQAEEGYGLLDQMEKMEKVAKDRGIKLPYPTIEDKETGKCFNREGINKICRMAEEGKIGYVLTERVDRWGRNMMENVIYVIHLFNLGVKIVTEDKIWDLDQFADFLIWVIRSHEAEETGKKIIKITQRGKRSAFQDKKWVHSNIPRCYKKDGKWIKRKGNSEEETIIKQLFEDFRYERHFPPVITKNNKKFREIFNEELTRGKLKSILANSTYNGRPSYGKEKITVVEDPELKIIETDIFTEVQNILKKRKREKKPATSKNIINQYAKEYGWGYVARVTGLVLLCPKNNCDGYMHETKENRISRGVTVTRYKCENCGFCKAIPTGAQLDEFKGKGLNVMSCPYCRETEFFIVREKLDIDLYPYEYTCNKCKKSFLSSANPNKYLREQPKIKRNEGTSEYKKEEKNKIKEKEDGTCKARMSMDFWTERFHGKVS